MSVRESVKGIPFFQPLVDIENGRRPIDRGQPESQILNEGNPDCIHARIFYIDNAFDGQAWWCDDCPRHDRIGYSPGYKIKLPPNALISTPNPKFGKEQFYAFRTNDDSVVADLDRDQWVPRKK